MKGKYLAPWEPFDCWDRQTYQRRVIGNNSLFALENVYNEHRWAGYPNDRPWRFYFRGSFHYFGAPEEAMASMDKWLEKDGYILLTEELMLLL